MKLLNRPRRFALVPAHEAEPAELTRAVSSIRSAVAPIGAAKRAAGSVQRARKRAPTVYETAHVVNRSPADGAILVEHASPAQLASRVPSGTKVYEEQWYRLERPARPWSKRSGAGLRKPRIAAGRSLRWTITVVVNAPGRRRRLRDALVTVMVNEDKGVGLEVKTDRNGKAHFELSTSTKRVDAVYVDPLHSAWPARISGVAVTPAGAEVEVVPLDLALPDARGMTYGKARAGSGKAVKVAVVDTGVGRHTALRVKRGQNTTTGEAAGLFRDEDGHGSHVAGVIAAAASGWRRGEASGVELHAYRIFEAGDDFASTFAIAAAIKDAAAHGCDLVNLSIGDSMADGHVRDAVEFAWSKGCVCVAATGNDGKARVDYPARYKKAVAVSALGLMDSWPDGAYLDWTTSDALGDALAGRRCFVASFSNTGAKVAVTAPGVAIVSTIFGNRWGVMSGTSMATPIATGVIARRLAASPKILGLARDAVRAAAIVTMAEQAAQDLHLPAGMQGKGLAR